MSNRRQFIQAGLALPLLSIAELASMHTVAAKGQDGGLLPEDFVYDSRFAEAVKAARVMGGQGIVLREINGDLTQLRREHYSRAWRGQPMTLAGLTAEDALFVLETLAFDHGMRVVHKVVHAGAQTTHGEKLFAWIIAPKALLPAQV